jgi:hypothetical protein
VKHNLFKFKFGKEKRDFFFYVKAGLLLKIPIEIVSFLPWFSKKQVFNFIDEVQLKFNIEAINDYIIKDDEFLKYRVERVINNALEEYED